MTEIHTSLPTEKRDQVARELQGTLVNLVDLTLQTKQAHWNVVGPNFRSLHLQLDEMVDAHRLWMDRVAERCGTLGVSPDGRAETVAKTSMVEEFPHGYVNDEKVVALFVDHIATVASDTRERMDRLEKLDPVTQDLFIEIVEGLEEQLWMLQAQSQ